MLRKDKIIQVGVTHIPYGDSDSLYDLLKNQNLILIQRHLWDSVTFVVRARKGGR